MLVIDWTPTVDPSELVRLMRETLEASAAVVLPGDNGYLALGKAGVECKLPGAAQFAWSAAALTAAGIVVPLAARRLMLRAWPAPLVLEFPTASGFTRFRCPEHPVFESVIGAVAELGPVLVADIGASTVDAAVRLLGGVVGLAVNVGEQPTGSVATVVQVDESGWRITEPGAVTRDEIERLAARIALFVCTGNTCRSPMAEALAKKSLADRLNCPVADLPARGFWMLSAGVATSGGDPAAPEAQNVVSEFDADLSSHASRPVNPQLLLAADDVIAMTRGHLYALDARFPGMGPTARLLCGEDDLDDPIGADAAVYRQCARTIAQHLERLLSEWVVS